MKIPSTTLSLPETETYIRELSKYVPELGHNSKSEVPEIVDAWIYKFPLYSQTTWVFKHKELLIIMQRGPKGSINPREKDIIHWVLVLPPEALKKVVEHIEKCLVYRRENRGVPWNFVVKLDNEEISLTRVGDLSTSVLKGHFGYIIENKSRRQETSITDLVMIQRGFLKFLKEIGTDDNKKINKV